MDPITPTRSEEELTKVSDANSEQTIRKSTAASPSQVAETVSTSTSTPTSQSQKTERVVGATPTAAKEYGQKKTLFRAYQVIWYFLGFIEILLAFRFFLKITAANPNSGFARFIYDFSGVFAGAFAGIYKNSRVDDTQAVTSIFEWGTLVAAIVYAIVAWALIKIFKLSKPTDPREVVNAVDRE